MFELTAAIDNEVRSFAKRLDAERGEDAYHDALVQVLNNAATAPLNTIAYLKKATRNKLYRIYEREKAYNDNIVSFLNNDPPRCVTALAKAHAAWGLVNHRPRQKRTHCRRGHEFTVESTIIRIGQHRTCRICKRAGQRVPRPAVNL